MANTNTNFAPTSIILDIEQGQSPGRRVFIPSAEAMRWDGAGAGTNCTVHSSRHDVHTYAELKITGRRVRKHTGGVWGTAARIRFTGDDSSDTTNEWHSCVVVG